MYNYYNYMHQPFSLGGLPESTKIIKRNTAKTSNSRMVFFIKILFPSKDELLLLKCLQFEPGHPYLYIHTEKQFFF